LWFFIEGRKKTVYIQKKVNFMSFLKFFKNLFGMSTETVETSEPQTKVSEPVEKVETKTEVPAKVVEPVVEKKSEDLAKTAKEIKAKVKRPNNNQKSGTQNNNSRPRPKRKRPAPKKPSQGE
jgi:hypothetical protein